MQQFLLQRRGSFCYHYFQLVIFKGDATSNQVPYKPQILLKYQN